MLKLCFRMTQQTYARQKHRNPLKPKAKTTATTTEEMLNDVC